MAAAPPRRSAVPKETGRSMVSKETYRALTQQEKQSIVDGLTYVRTYDYRPDMADEAAAIRREQEQAWRDNIRAVLESVRVNGSVKPDDIKKDILVVLSAEATGTDVPSTKTETKLVPLTEADIEDICSLFDSFEGVRVMKMTVSKATIAKENKLYIPRPNTFFEITTLIAKQQKKFIRSQLKDMVFAESIKDVCVQVLKQEFYDYYVKAKLAPGVFVGTIAGQAIGEMTTQDTLNVHKAPGIMTARLTTSSMSRSEEIYNVSVPSLPSLTIYLEGDQSYETLKLHSYRFREVLIRDIVDIHATSIFRFDRPPAYLGVDWHEAFDAAFPPNRSVRRQTWVLRLKVDTVKAYANRITPLHIAQCIERNFASIRCLYTPLADPCVVDLYVELGGWRDKVKFMVEAGVDAPESYILNVVWDEIVKVRLAGVQGIQQLFPVYMPLARFISPQQVPLGTHFVMDRKTMRTEGVKPEQILHYVEWRLRSLRIDRRATIGGPVQGKQKWIAVPGLTADEAKNVKDYGGREPFSRFFRNARVVGTTITIEFDTDLVALYDTTVSKLLTLILREIPHVRFNLQDDNATVTIVCKTREAANDLRDGKYIVDLSAVLVSFNQWAYQTIGSNYRAVMSMEAVDVSATTTDDPNEIYDVLGIEAATAWIDETLNVVANPTRKVDVRHFSVMADTMCYTGTPRPVTKKGQSHQNTGVVSNAVNEEALRTLATGAFLGTVDRMAGPAQQVLLGILDQNPPAEAQVKETYIGVPAAAEASPKERPEERGPRVLAGDREKVLSNARRGSKTSGPAEKKPAPVSAPPKVDVDFDSFM